MTTPAANPLAPRCEKPSLRACSAMRRATLAVGLVAGLSIVAVVAMGGCSAQASGRIDALLRMGQPVPSYHDGHRYVDGKTPEDRIRESFDQSRPGDRP